MAWLAAALATIAGFVDAVGYVALNVFTAHMSGNTARLGVYLGGGRWLPASLAIYAVVIFVGAVMAGAIVMELGARREWRSPDALLLTVQIVLLVVFTALGSACCPDGRSNPHDPGVFLPLLFCAVAAMGLQTASLQRLSGNTVRTTFVTGMLTSLADELAVLVTRIGGRARRNRGYLTERLSLPAGPRAHHRLRLILGIWFGYVAGAIAGSYLHGHWGFPCMSVPLAALAGLAASAYSRSTSGRPATG